MKKKTIYEYESLVKKKQANEDFILLNNTIIY